MARYGTVLVDKLARELTKQYGKGFKKSNLFQMRSFYRTYAEILQTASGEFDSKIAKLHKDEIEIGDVAAK